MFAGRKDGRDGRRVDDDVGDALVGEPAMQPEGIAAGLVAADDGGGGGQVETPLGLVDLLKQARQVACSQRAEPGRLSVPNGEGEFPLAPAQLKSEVQTRAARGTLYIAGRCHDGLLKKSIDHSTHQENIRQRSALS